MKKRHIILPLLCICTTMVAQNKDTHNHAEDSTDIFFRHLNLNEVTVNLPISSTPSVISQE